MAKQRSWQRRESDLGVSRIGFRFDARSALAAAATALACAVLALPLTSLAATAKTGPPTVSTGNVSKVRGTSAELEGTVDPNEATTTYYFQYGPTVAYGSQTQPGTLPPGDFKVKVGQTVTGLLPDYHYRIVASNVYGTTPGRDHVFLTKSLQPKFDIPREKEAPATVYGSAFVLEGRLVGVNDAYRKVTLEASPYPYREPFSEVGAPVLTNADGHFSLRVASLLQSTQFRVATVEPRPLDSAVVTAHVVVRVTLRVTTTKYKGFVRLHGTVTPAEPGARIYFQLRKLIRPGGHSERSTRYVTQFSAIVRRATHTISRFSYFAKITRGGHYRALVALRTGPYYSGTSSVVMLAATPNGVEESQSQKEAIEASEG